MAKELRLTALRPRRHSSARVSPTLGPPALSFVVFAFPVSSGLVDHLILQISHLKSKKTVDPQAAPSTLLS